MSYKNYQQVLNFATDRKQSVNTKKLHPSSGPEPMKRTKTGCLTCRRRKKKCDENTEGGKCQACIRNFLDCCWASGPETGGCATTQSTEAEQQISDKPVSTVSPESPKIDKTGASAYPSPVSSPKAVPAEEVKHIKSFKLPPAAKIKVTKPTKPMRRKRLVAPKPEFVITSFDSRNALCQIK